MGLRDSRSHETRVSLICSGVAALHAGSEPLWPRLRCGMDRFWVRSGVPGLYRALTRRCHVILVFHRIHKIVDTLHQFDSCPTYSLGGFCKLLEHLRRSFEFVSLRRLTELGPRSAPAAAVTFDDGWRDVYDVAFPVLSELSIPATVFVTTGKIGRSEPFWQQSLGCLFLRAAEDPTGAAARRLTATLRLRDGGLLSPRVYLRTVRNWKRLSDQERSDRLAQAGWAPAPDTEDARCFLSEAEIQAMSRAGHEFGSHTVTHTILTAADGSTVQAELTESKATLQRILGRKMDMIAYPNGNWSGEVLRRARALGYRIGCTVSRRRVSQKDDLLTLPRVEPPPESRLRHRWYGFEWEV